MCHRVPRFWEFAQNGGAPTVQLERAGLTENLPLHGPGLTGMLNGAAPDCGPRPGRTSPALRWSVIAVKPNRKGGSARLHRNWTSDEKMSKWTSKHHFLTSCQKYRKIWKMFLLEYCRWFFIPIYKNFVWNLMPKL